ncbi:aspartyl-phosphate phosphatase Spo0E family protein [Halobacillus naozhouensis]
MVKYSLYSHTLGGTMMGSGHDQQDQLIYKIEELRRRMTETALEEGFSSSKSVRMSQELDYLLNQIQEKNEA